MSVVLLGVWFAVPSARLLVTLFCAWPAVWFTVRLAEHLAYGQLLASAGDVVIIAVSAWGTWSLAQAGRLVRGRRLDHGPAAGGFEWSEVLVEDGRIGEFVQGDDPYFTVRFERAEARAIGLEGVTVVEMRNSWVRIPLGFRIDLEEIGRVIDDWRESDMGLEVRLLITNTVPPVLCSGRISSPIATIDFGNPDDEN